MKRLIDYDSDTKTAVWHDYDHLTKETTIAEIQDVESLLESNKAIRH